MDIGDKKFGVYDPATKMFYTVPAASQEEFARFMRSLGLAVGEKSPNQDLKIQPRREQFDDFDMVIEEVRKTPYSPSSQ